MKIYETVIGLEVHVELATKTKIFCGCTTDFGGEPNTHCCPICMGMPGTLPVLNRKVVEFATATGLALNCEITEYNMFDRKNYFYPDLPKAYQISQLYTPIGRNGYIDIDTPEGRKRIGIHELHMEEDAGKLIHDEVEDVTLVDYNRCGVPLIEIVSEPDMRSAQEVIAYLTKLRLILQYLGVSDCKMQEGSLRADINLSVREQGSEELGVRTEMKNMSSFKAIAKAIEGESKRQIELLEGGKSIIQETRRYDEDKDISFAMRSKENAQDYRYFPEPDIPSVRIDSTWRELIRNNQPELRDEKKARYESEYGIPAYDAAQLTSDKVIADLFEATVSICNKPKEVSNWLMVETMRILKEYETDASELLRENGKLSLPASKLAKLIDMVDKGIINRTVSKQVFEAIMTQKAEPEKYVEEYELGMVDSDELVRKNVLEVISQNPKSVQDIAAGKTKAYGYLTGQTMKALQGKANPEKINIILRELLEKRH